MVIANVGTRVALVNNQMDRIDKIAKITGMEEEVKAKPRRGGVS